MREIVTDVCDEVSLPPIPLLYQSGYLTIKSANGERLKLCIPNAEVRSLICEAFDQIIERKYHDPYVGKGKPVYGIGLNFNPKEGSRGIDEPVVMVVG